LFVRRKRHARYDRFFVNSTDGVGRLFPY